VKGVIARPALQRKSEGHITYLRAKRAASGSFRSRRRSRCRRRGAGTFRAGGLWRQL